jgi:hypothetical protein
LEIKRHQVVKIYDEMEIKLHAFLTVALGRSGQIHAPTALLSGKALPASTDRSLGRPEGWFGTLWKREK